MAVIPRRNEKQRLCKTLGGKQGAVWDMCKCRVKELIYEVPEEELKVKTINAVMDETFVVAKESLKKLRLVPDLNAMNDVEVTRLTNNDNKQNSSVYNNQTTISRDKNMKALGK